MQRIRLWLGAAIMLGLVIGISFLPGGATEARAFRPCFATCDEARSWASSQCSGGWMSWFGCGTDPETGIGSFGYSCNSGGPPYGWGGGGDINPSCP